MQHDNTRVVAFTDEIHHHLAEIRRLVYAPDKVNVVQFRFSYRHLLALRDRIVPILGTRDSLTSRHVKARGSRPAAELSSGR
jgi:hypothetical protein